LDKHLELGAEFFFIPSVRNMQHGDYFTSSACTPQTAVNSATNFRQSTSYFTVAGFSPAVCGITLVFAISVVPYKIFNVIKVIRLMVTR